MTGNMFNVSSIDSFATSIIGKLTRSIAEGEARVAWYKFVASFNKYWNYDNNNLRFRRDGKYENKFSAGLVDGCNTEALQCNNSPN
jgi:hypothetical protein